MNTPCLTHGYAEGCYILPPLPYAPESLEPFLDAETLMVHHDRHHAAYVAGANAAADTLRRVAAGELDALAAAAAAQSLAFNLGGHILHCLYWNNMSPVPSQLPLGGAFGEALCNSFGDADGMLRVFRSVTLSVQGSGWGVLGVEPVSRKMIVTGICRHQDVLVPAFQPLLVCDVWEHAYYLRYRNNRAAYLEEFMSKINWSVVEERFNRICCHA